MNIREWAARWNVSDAALAELFDVPREASPKGFSEEAIQVKIRLEATAAGCRVWRNNVGAFKTDTGRWVRYGLSNDSTAVNRRIKSSDLIGIRPVVITPAHVGSTIGQFISREVKAGGWLYSGSERELAQQNWHHLINSLGGDSCFASDTGSLS